MSEEKYLSYDEIIDQCLDLCTGCNNLSDCDTSIITNPLYVNYIKQLCEENKIKSIKCNQYEESRRINHA